jgi:CRP-like cAMP-binding protein
MLFIQRDQRPMQHANNINEKQDILACYLKSNETEKAFKLLCQLAVLCAKEKDFIRAETFRDQLYEVDGSARTAIGKVNGIIAQEKIKAVSASQRQLWPGFFNGLSKEEAIDFFIALQTIEFESEHIVLKQGAPNDRLYLIDQGQIKIVYKADSRQGLIKTLSRGDFFGEDTFFSVNVCTVSAVALSDVKLRFLDKKGLERLIGKHRTTGAGLRKICFSGRSVFDCLRQKRMDRRQDQRIHYQTNVSVQILDSKNQKPIARNFSAELWDISKQGLSFYFESKSPDTVRRLIGRTLSVRLYLAQEGKKVELALTGVVLGVQNHPMDEYSVHMKLERPFSSEAIQMIKRIASNSRYDPSVSNQW